MPVDSRLPSLDGLRCLSLLIVMGGHAIGTRGFPLGVANAYPIGYLTAFALKLFFCLSGFLITRQLLEERAGTGGIALGRFYLRRVFRIFPAAYVYIAAIGLLTWSGIASSNPADMLAAATYTTNFYYPRTHWIAHFWSLAVEEQFYLLWPFLLSRLALTTATRVLLGTLLIAPIVRYAIVSTIAPRYSYEFWFPMNMDALACGCLLAISRERLWQSARYRQLLCSQWFPLLTLVPPALSLFHDRPRTYHLLLVTLISGGIALTIDSCLRFPGRGIGPFLNFRLVRLFGTWSYSGYIWQQLFMNRYSGWAITAFPISVLATLAAAMASYHLIERPLHAYGRSRFR